jgi:hypothetical protein
MWPYNAAAYKINKRHTKSGIFNIPKLSARIGQTDADAGCHRTFECSDALRPDDWICTTRTGHSDHETEVADDRIVYRQKDNIADDGRRLN